LAIFPVYFFMNGYPTKQIFSPGFIFNSSKVLVKLKDLKPSSARFFNIATPKS